MDLDDPCYDYDEAWYILDIVLKRAGLIVRLDVTALGTVFFGLMKSFSIDIINSFDTYQTIGKTLVSQVRPKV